MMKEISLHLLDLLENCVKAEATCVSLAISIDTRMDRLSVELKDNGKGIPPAMLDKVFDPFYTTRTTRRIGLGLPLIRQTVEACEGSLTLDSHEGEGTELCFQMRYSHWDRPPMGNLVDTLLTFLIGNKYIDFYYKHDYNKSLFVFSTKDLEAELGDLGFLDQPEVYEFLRQYLWENLTAIYGGDTNEVTS